jgi:hypothetical protein
MTAQATAPDRESEPASKHHFVFIGGVQRSGVRLLRAALAQHPLVSALHVPDALYEDGQYVQSVFPSDIEFGGPHRFRFDPSAHLTEESVLATDDNRRLLLQEWGRYWDLSKPVLLESSGSNIMRTRFLQRLFPDATFLMMMRHPAGVLQDARSLSETQAKLELEHWLACYDCLEVDREHLRRLRVIRFEDFRSDPDATLASVFAFLGLEQEAMPSAMPLQIGEETPQRPTGRRRRRRAPTQTQRERSTLEPETAKRFQQGIARFGYAFDVLNDAEPITRSGESETVKPAPVKKALPPSFIIIGAQKAGTTPLFGYLSAHPNVVLPAKKEQHFFDTPRKYKYGVAPYLMKFPEVADDELSTHRITGEATPYYMFHPRVPRLVHEFFPGMKLLVVLRNPADRAYSHYQMMLRFQSQERMTFEDALEAEPQRMHGEMERMESDPGYSSRAYREYSYLGRGRYLEQLLRWERYFPRAQMLIVESEALKRQPDVEMRRVCEFLEIPANQVVEAKLVNSGKYEPMKPATREWLVEYFAPHNRALYAHLGVDFGWR